MFRNTSSAPPALPSRPARRVHAALRIFVLLLLACFLFEWGFALVHRLLLHAAYPYTTPLFDPAYRFADWQYMVMRTLHFSDPGFLLRDEFGPRFSYPAPCLYIYVLFVKLFVHSTRAMLVCTCMLFLLATAFFSICLRNINAGAWFQAAAWLTLLLGNPTLFLLDRANIEAFLWFPLAVGIAAFIFNRPYLAAFCFAIAACMKIYPALFLLLFLPRRQYKPLLLAITATIALSLAAYAGIGPTTLQAMRDMSVNGRQLRDEVLVSSLERTLRWDHSLFAEEKQLVLRVDLATRRATRENPPRMFRSLHVYSIATPILFLLLYLLRLRRLPLLNQLVAFSICSVLLPYISYEYTLIHIYIAWAAFLVFLAQDVAPGRITFSPTQLRLIVVSFAIVIAPITALSFEYFSGQVKGLALIVLLTAFSLWPMPSTLFRDRFSPTTRPHPDISML